MCLWQVYLEYISIMEYLLIFPHCLKIVEFIYTLEILFSIMVVWYMITICCLNLKTSRLAKIT